MKLISAIFIGIVLLSFPRQNEVPKTPAKKVQHVCPLVHCPFKFELSFTHGCGYCERGQDCFVLDSIHFVNPTYDYDQTETIFNQLNKAK